MATYSFLSNDRQVMPISQKSSFFVPLYHEQKSQAFPNNPQKACSQNLPYTACRVHENMVLQIPESQETETSEESGVSLWKCDKKHQAHGTTGHRYVPTTLSFSSLVNSEVTFPGAPCI